MLYWPMTNVLYVEGYALDRFAEGLWGLQPVHRNRVGLVFDVGIEKELLLRHLQVVDATRASLGLPVVEYVVTDTPLQVEKWVDPKSGQSTGRIQHPDSLLRAVQTSIDRSMVNAVAVVARFPDDDVEDTDDYRQGMGIDILAGVEAVISHMVVKNFGIPCAHAPALSPMPLSMPVSPKAAAEEIGYTFLPCVLAGLSNAPQYTVNKLERDSILASDVDSVILPLDACGGEGALAFANRKRNKVTQCSNALLASVKCFIRRGLCTCTLDRFAKGLWGCQLILPVPGLLSIWLWIGCHVTVRHSWFSMMGLRKSFFNISKWLMQHGLLLACFVINDTDIPLQGHFVADFVFANLSALMQFSGSFSPFLCSCQIPLSSFGNQNAVKGFSPLIYACFLYLAWVTNSLIRGIGSIHW